VGGRPLRASGPEAAGPPFLLDTHIWVWYVFGSERLPRGLREALDAAVGRLWLSPISVWEVAMLHEGGRLELEGGPRRWVVQALERFPLDEASLTREVALRSHEVALVHRDPADRLIAATALVHDLTLVSVDERLAAASGVRIRSA
jgi:PIN domain nuclease of toxin-antitoxin system